MSAAPAEGRFEACLQTVLALEGGYVDDPRDRGGPTNMGVTLAAYSRALGRPATPDSLRDMTLGEAASLYRAFYWRPAGCEALAAGLDLMAFDAAVNMGVGEARRLLATAGAGSASERIGRMSAARAARYRTLAGFPAFGAGWLKRVDTVTAEALAAARAQEATA
ncbi:MAG TPA: glycosyl hydrolase 108 family protein [Caulobacteraceae bacterium]|nr:glycosyl hydrolase 108 family protein [Caulobacteraceae bacterium]